jgi:hypothetical protein
MAEQQYRGIPDLHSPVIDLRYGWAEHSALPTGVVFKDALTGGSDGTVAFEGLIGGRLSVEASTSFKFLRFDGWDMADPDIYRRVLFEVEGLYVHDDMQFVVSLRDTTNLVSGVYFASRRVGNSEVGHCNGTTTVATVHLWSPTKIGRNLKYTIGVGWEVDPMLGRKDVICTCAGQVIWRATQSALNLANTCRPMLSVRKHNAGTTTFLSHGARLRLWRHR